MFDPSEFALQFHPLASGLGVHPAIDDPPSGGTIPVTTAGNTVDITVSSDVTLDSYIVEIVDQDDNVVGTLTGIKLEPGKKLVVKVTLDRDIEKDKKYRVTLKVKYFGSFDHTIVVAGGDATFHHRKK